MADSKRLAALLGHTLIALGTSEVMNWRIWETNTAPLIYLNGLLLFVAGLAIVLVHNRWTRGWPVMITLAVWVAILGGLFRMFAPEVQQAGQNAPTAIISASLVAVLGLFLTFKAYFKTKEERQATPPSTSSTTSRRKIERSNS